MIPLRRLLIVEAHDELPYPEGTACAEVLRATTTARRAAASGSSAAWRSARLSSSAWRCCSCCPSELRCELPVLPKAELALELAPALLGVGYILGYRQSAVWSPGR